MGEFVLDHVVAALAQPRRRLRELETSLAALERRNHELETLVLELQARLTEADAR
jgi:hypothetical protein